MVIITYVNSASGGLDTAPVTRNLLADGIADGKSLSSGTGFI